MTPANDLKVDLRRTVADLRRLRYQIEYEVRAAGTRARTRWNAFLGQAKARLTGRRIVQLDDRK